MVEESTSRLFANGKTAAIYYVRQNKFGMAMSPDSFPAKRFGEGSRYARLVLLLGPICHDTHTVRLTYTTRCEQTARMRRSQVFSWFTLVTVV